MLRWRLIYGVGLVAALAALCWLDARADRPGVYLTPLVIVAAVLAAGEMLRMFRARGEPPAAWSVYVGVLLPVAASGAAVIWHDRPEVLAVGRLGWLALGLAAGIIVAFLAEMRRYEAPGRSTASVAQAGLAVLYVGGLVGMLVQLRLVGIMPAVAKPSASLMPLLSMIATVKLSDIGQYVVGRWLGSAQLAPLISPGKTWEGAGGGIGLSAVIAAIVLPLLLVGTNGLTASRMLVSGAFALTLAVAGLAGDLSESLLKRDAGVKDSSDWLPGFGGVLDLLDSLLFAAPVAYLWWAIGAL